MYVMPVIKTARDRTAFAQGRDFGRGLLFLGTDSAPHPYARKVSTNGVPGMFNAPVALETYAQVFEEEGALRQIRGLCLAQWTQALSHARRTRNGSRLEKNSPGPRRGGQRCRPRRARSDLSRRRDHRLESGRVIPETTMTGFPDKEVISELTAKMLMEVDAVRFMTDKPFIFTSGWRARSYTDCRRLISFPACGGR